MGPGELPGMPPGTPRGAGPGPRNSGANRRLSSSRYLGSRKRGRVDQNEKRDLTSRALGAQIPNPGSVSRRAGRDVLVFSPRAGVVGVHFATVSLAPGAGTPQGQGQKGQGRKAEGVRGGPCEDCGCVWASASCSERAASGTFKMPPTARTRDENLKISCFARQEKESGFGICAPRALEIRSRISCWSTKMRFREPGSRELLYRRLAPGG
jgi:hypothetical protein